MKNSITFLLGSSISIPSGFPSTSGITEQVLTGNNIIRFTGSRYYLKSDSNDWERQLTDGYLPKILSLLRSIQNLMGSYKKQVPLNYEILYYFIQQLHAY